MEDSPEAIVEVFVDGLEEDGYRVHSDRATKVIAIEIDELEIDGVTAIIKQLARRAEILLTSQGNAYTASK